MSVINLPNSGLGWDYRQSHNAPIPGAIGGYEHGGAQYLFLYQGSEFGVGDSHIHALRSTDLGLTWTDTGDINIPQIAGIDPFATPTYTTCMDGNIVYLMAVDLDGTNSGSDPHTGPILLFKYNLTSNTFGSSSSVGGAPTVWKSWNGTTFSPRSGICLHLLLRGPGDMLLLYTDVETSGGNKFARIAVATFNGSSCGTAVVLAGQAGVANPFMVRCATLDASHILHVILSNNDSHFWYHVAMSPGGSFGSFQTIETDAYFTNDTSNLLDFTAPADTIAFLGVRNRSSSHANGDLAIYSAPGGSLSPTWTFHNLPSTANPVPDPVIAPDWIGALGYLDGTLHAFWTQTGIPPGWSVSAGMGEIRGSTASVTDLATWTAETSLMGPFDSGSAHWGAAQVAVWSGPGIGLGVLGNFEGFDDDGSTDPIETSRVTTVPPAGGGPPTVTCGSPPDGKVGTPYSHAMPSTHTGAFTVTVTAGALPDGLTMDTTGLITGTPTAAGAFSYTTTITDTGGAGGTIPTHPGDIAQDHLGPSLGSSSMGQFAFTVGDAVYAFITNPTGTLGTSCKIAVHKSTDLGQTWTEVASGSSPAIPVVQGSPSPMWTVARDGSSVIALWAEMHFPALLGQHYTVAHIGKAVFSFSSESWSGQTQIPNPGLDIWQDQVFDSAHNFGREYTLLQLIVRGPGNYILFYQGTCNELSATPPAIARQARASYSTFNGSTFGPEVQLPGQNATYYYFIYGGCADESGLVTLLYERSVWPFHSPSTHIVMSCSLTAANALGSPVDITSAAYDNGFRRVLTTPVAYTAGGVNHVAFGAWTLESGVTTTAVRVFDAISMASPSWTINSLVTNDQSIQPVAPGTFADESYLMSLMSDGTKLVVVWTQSTWIDDLRAAFYYSSTPVGGAFAWTTPAPLWLPPVLDGSPSEASQVNLFLTTGGFGVLGVSSSTHFDPASVAVQSSFIPSGGGTGGTGSVNCAITITAPTLGLGCASPPGGVVGSPYIHTFPVSGGTPPYTFAITSGILPPGLTLDSLNGEVSGTPTLAGDYEFVIQVSDGFGSTVGTCDIVITVTDLPVSDIGCGSPPGGQVGVAYDHIFPVTDIPSGATVTYSITGGALPPGLTLNTSTGEVTGTPTTPGHYTFTITVTVEEVTVGGWRRCPLVIQHGQVPADQTAFPVLVTEANLPAEMMTLGGANAAQSNGGDIRFSSDSAGASRLACEIVVWTQNATPALAKAEIWVPVNVLTASDVTIYVWYNSTGGLSQPAANAAFGSQAVWGSNYKGVYHMGDGVSMTFVDSTGNQNLIEGATPAMVPTTSGKIGGATSAPTGSRYYRFPSISALEGVATFSWSLWANVTGMGTSGNEALFSHSSDFNRDILLGCSTTQVFAQVNNGADGSGSYNSDIRSVWHLLTLVFDGGQTGNANRLKVYDQGAQQTLSIGYTVPATTAAGSFQQYMNAYTVSAFDWSGSGIFDEMRVNATALSANWILTEYHNQNSPSTFTVAGTPVSVSGSGPFLLT